jgi:hypothetical protein
VRAERSGTGDRRVYTLTVTCTDASGNAARSAAEVAVPLRQVKGFGEAGRSKYHSARPHAVPPREQVVRALGLALAIVFSSVIVWIYQRQPQTFAQVTGGIASSVGAYRVDAEAFDQGRRFFRSDQFVEARAAFARADPAERDARTQFYIGYAYYRQGWGRVYSDDELFRKGIEAVDKAIALSPPGGLRVDDPELQMKTADELRAELQRGITREADDFNPLRLFGSRK